jgi:hypothetical protein
VSADTDPDLAGDLAEIISSLASIPRLPASEGEREAAGALLGRRWLRRVGTGVSAVATAALADVALRSRNSTDGCVPLAHGFPAARLVSVDDSKLLPNCHLYSDTPENVDYRSATSAVRLTRAVIRKLA